MKCIVRTTTRCTVLLAILLIGAGCHRDESVRMLQQLTASRPPASVTVAEAIARDVPMYLDAIGKTVAVETVSIMPQVSGKVIAAHIEDGAYVAKGQLLFEIDPRPFEAALAAAKATLAQCQAELDWAKADFKRTEELTSSNVVSQLEYDQKKSALGVALAKVEAAAAAVKTAELNLEYTKIYSPIDGRAGARLVDPGNIVRANDSPMLVIQRFNPIYAEFTVTENDLGTVRKFMTSRKMEVGHEQQMGLKVLVDVPANSPQMLSALGVMSATTQPAQPYSMARVGTLTFLDNTVQSSTGTVKLRATVPNADRYFWPGQFVNVRLILATRKNAVLIPVEAVQIGQNGPFVYVVADDQTAQQNQVTLGQRQDDMVVVEKGLNAGQKVIVSGQMLVVPGGPVLVIDQHSLTTQMQHQT